MKVDQIPHMGAHAIGDRLCEWAAEARGAIVEVGSWLGAGTAYLALGALESGAELHVYDRWRANASESNKARWQGVDIAPGADTLPFVRSAIDPIGATVHFHQGEVQAAKWNGKPISLYVDDASKRPAMFGHIRRTFWPYLTDGAVLVMMDYYYFETTGNPAHRAQYEYMEKRPEFVAIERRMAGQSITAFRYRRPS